MSDLDGAAVFLVGSYAGGVRVAIHVSTFFWVSHLLSIFVDGILFSHGLTYPSSLYTFCLPLLARKVPLPNDTPRTNLKLFAVLPTQAFFPRALFICIL